MLLASPLFPRSLAKNFYNLFCKMLFMTYKAVINNKITLKVLTTCCDTQ
jgi:hypothetical protein